jgi:hypothetical protein
MSEFTIAPPAITSVDIEPEKYSLENLQRMRDRFPGVPDETLARYLIARSDDFEKAQAFLQKVMRWKSQHWPVLQRTCGKEFSIGKLYVRGVDKEGRPLIIWHSRLNNPNERDLEEVGRLCMWWAEYAVRKAMPENRSKFVFLVNRCDQQQGDMEMIKYSAQRFQVCLNFSF